MRGPVFTKRGSRIAERLNGGHGVSQRSTRRRRSRTADAPGQLLPSLLEVRRRNGDADALDRLQVQVGDQPRRGPPRCGGQRFKSMPATRTGTAPSCRRRDAGFGELRGGEVPRFDRTRAAHETEQHRPAGAQVLARQRTERREMLNTVQGAEVRHDAVERFRRRQCIEERREVVEPSRAGNTVARASSPACARRRSNRLTISSDGCAGDDEFLTVAARKAVSSPVPHPISSTRAPGRTSREGLVRALPEQLKDLTGGKCSVSGASRSKAIVAAVAARVITRSPHATPTSHRPSNPLVPTPAAPALR